MVLEIYGMVAVGVEGDKLAGGVHEPGSRDGFLGDFVNSGQKIVQRGLALAFRLDFIHRMAVRRPDGENGAGDGVASVGVLFVDDQVGPLLVLNGDGAGLARKQLHMVLLQVQDVVCHGGRFFDGVHARFQIGDVDLAVAVGNAVEVVGAVLDPGDAEMDAAQPGSVRAGLDKPQGGLGGVGKHKIGVLVRVHLHHPHSVINQITVRGLQLSHFIRAGGQLTEVDLAVNIGGELLPVAAAHQLELKTDVGQRFHGHAVHLDKMDARFQRVKKDQLPRLRVTGL